MAVDYGTYDGHKVVADAAKATADRIQKGHQFKLSMELQERERQDRLEHIRDQGERWDHMNLLTDSQTRHEGEKQLLTNQQWKKIQKMTPAEYANLRSITAERDTLLDPRKRNVEASTENLISTARARDEEEKYYTEAQTRNVESQKRERDRLLEPRYDQIRTETRDIKSRTKERDRLREPRRDQVIATTDDIVSRTDERDTLLPGRKEQIDATTGNIISQTDYRDDVQTPLTQAQTSGLVQSQEHQEHDFQRQLIDENRADKTEEIRKKYYMDMADKLDDLDIYDEDAGEFRGDAAKMLVQAIDNAYPKDIAQLDPEGKLNLDNINDIGADVQRLYTTEAMNRVMSEVSKAGLSKEQIQQLIDSDPQVKGYFDAFYRQGLGVNQEGSNYGPLGEALGYGPNQPLSRDQQFDKVDDLLINLPHSDRVYSKLGDDGQLQIVEEDAGWGSMNDDEYTVKWDKGKPYIVGDGNKQIYLDDQDQLVAEFD